MTAEIYGIIPPMVTPFNGDETIDEAALRAEVQYLIDVAGVHGLAVGGSTGEGHTLTTDELRQVVGAMDQSERFHWLTTPRSTLVQPGPIHSGVTDDAAGTFEHLFRVLVERPE